MLCAGDIVKAQSDATIKPSAITSIDDQNVYLFLGNLAQKGAFQDPDALYNTLFFEKASIAIGQGAGTFSGGGRGRFIYPGPITEVTYENGTTSKYTNYANVLASFSGVHSGESFYKKFCR
jgi:hypothetical protein